MPLQCLPIHWKMSYGPAMNSYRSNLVVRRATPVYNRLEMKKRRRLSTPWIKFWPVWYKPCSSWQKK